MGKYDGPSYYKKDHPKIKSLDQEKPRKGNTFESAYKKTVPDKVQTRNEKHKKAKDYMETPSDIEWKAHYVDPPPERYKFRSKYIPKSLQDLNGLKNKQKKESLISKLEKRLTKDQSSYLLFEEYLAEEVKPVSKRQPPKINQKTKRKAKRVQEKMASNLKKPNSGLHRSLSKIIAEDQEALKNGKNNLDSLFSNGK